jgi:copper chaperone CopZ
MQISKILLCLFLTLVVSISCDAQNVDETQEAEDKVAVEHAVKITTTRMMKLFEKANLTVEQMEKSKAVIRENIGSLTEARKAQSAMLTDEQKQNRMDAIAEAKAGGTKDSQLNAIGIKALGLTKEEKAEYDAADQKFNETNRKIQESISALLTQEQRELLPKQNLQNVAEKTKTVVLSLPQMECGGCAAAVRKALTSVDGIANIKTDHVKNVCTFDAPMSLDVKAMSDKFAADGILQFKGWTYAKGPIL